MKYGVGSENRHQLDSRNRLFVPARIRDLLGKDLIVSCEISHDRTCLGIYSAEGWDARIERLLADCETEAERDDTLDIMCSRMIPAELDEQGRVILTKQLVRYAGIEKAVVVTGAGDHANIWAAEVYDEMREEQNDLDALKRIMNRKHTKPLA